MLARGNAHSVEYFHRSQLEISQYGSELYEYVFPPESRYAAAYLKGRPQIWETWHYAGWLVLIALAAYPAARLRGWRMGGLDTRLVDRLVGLLATFIVLSLAGGPGTLLFPLVSTFRCYGRAGLLAVALWSVVAPLILCGISRQWTGSWARGPLQLAVLTLAVMECGAVRAQFPCYDPATPGWVSWLAAQPPETRLAAFAPYYEGGVPGEAGQRATIPIGWHRTITTKRGTGSGSTIERFMATRRSTVATSVSCKPSFSATARLMTR